MPAELSKTRGKNLKSLQVKPMINCNWNVGVELYVYALRLLSYSHCVLFQPYNFPRYNNDLVKILLSIKHKLKLYIFIYYSYIIFL